MYGLSRSGSIVRIADGALIPVDDQNMDYAAYLGWVAKGNVAEALEDDPPIVSVTPWQIRKALTQMGLRAAVEAAVSVADQDTRDGWQYATEFRRDNALILTIASVIGKSDGDIDALFALAGRL